jgi:hypothetical protein
MVKNSFSGITVVQGWIYFNDNNDKWYLRLLVRDFSSASSWSSRCKVDHGLDVSGDPLSGRKGEPPFAVCWILSPLA